MDRAKRPSESECFDYHRDYVAIVPDGDILDTLKEQLESIHAFIVAIPDDAAGTIHAPYRWTVRQVVEHCIDAERVFGYRALRFAAGDPTELPGWDEQHFAAHDYGPRAGLVGLAEEYRALRRANVSLLSRLADDAWGLVGTADGRKVSVRTLAWLMAGHWLHHRAILAKRLGEDG